MWGSVKNNGRNVAQSIGSGVAFTSTRLSNEQYGNVVADARPDTAKVKEWLKSRRPKSAQAAPTFDNTSSTEEHCMSLPELSVAPATDGEPTLRRRHVRFGGIGDPSTELRSINLDSVQSENIAK
jgi:hypothetical protein